MELGIVINELNENVPVMDAYSYNVSFAVEHNSGDPGHSESGLGAGPDTDQRLGAREKNPAVGMKRRYDARFVRPVPPLFIEPVLTSPADYVHLGSLPKRAKLDEYYVRSTVPGIVYDALLQRPHNVAVSDPLNALGRGDNSTVVMKSSLYGPDVRETASSQTRSNQQYTFSPPPVRTRTEALLPDPPDASTSHSVPTASSPDIPTQLAVQTLQPPPPPPPPLPPPSRPHAEHTVTAGRSETPPPTHSRLVADHTVTVRRSETPPPDATAVPVPVPPPPPPPLPSDAAPSTLESTPAVATDEPRRGARTGTGGNGGGSDDWLSEIRRGIALRPVSDAGRSVRESGGAKTTSGGGGAESSRDDLMDSIRRGVSLRPVAVRRSPTRADAERDERYAMSRALMNRRAAIDPMEILRSRFKIMERVRVDSEEDDEDTDDGASFSETDGFDE